MPVKVQRRGKRYRIVESETRKLAVNKAGTPLDGGGHTKRPKAVRQMRAINANL